jgi:hypothetical protein
LDGWETKISGAAPPGIEEEANSATYGVLKAPLLLFFQPINLSVVSRPCAVAGGEKLNRHIDAAVDRIKVLRFTGSLIHSGCVLIDTKASMPS